jgi:hypothetical protein
VEMEVDSKRETRLKNQNQHTTYASDSAAISFKNENRLQQLSPKHLLSNFA